MLCNAQDQVDVYSINAQTKAQQYNVHSYIQTIYATLISLYDHCPQRLIQHT